MASIESIV